MVTPAPVSERKPDGDEPPEVMVKAFAPGLNTTLSTATAAESETAVVLEVAKVAMSLVPLGTVDGVQIAAVFQSPLAELDFQVALPASVRVMRRQVRRISRADFIRCEFLLEVSKF